MRYYRCLRNERPSEPYKFIGFGAMEVTKPYKFIWFGDIDGTKPYEFIRFLWAFISQTPVVQGFGPQSKQHAPCVCRNMRSARKPDFRPGNGLALGGPHIYQLYLYLLAAGTKNTEYPRTGLRIGLRGWFLVQPVYVSSRSPSQGSRGRPWARRSRKSAKDPGLGLSSYPP